MLTIFKCTYSSVVLYTFTMLYNYHIITFRTFSFIIPNKLYPLNNNSPFPLLSAPGKPLFYFLCL